MKNRDIVGNYFGEKTIVNTLDTVGFTDIDVKHHTTEPFYNITTVKPK
ncbi:MAG: hypothetical protein ABIJ08_06160 [Nanoarchaeota archaeon]